GAAVVTHLHAAAVPAALQLDHPRLPVDERDLPAQVLAIRASVRIAIGVAPVRIAIGVAISIVIPAVMAPAIAAVADVVDHLDPPGPKVTAGLRQVDADDVAALQPLHRIRAALVEQARAAVIPGLLALRTSGAPVIYTQEDAPVPGVHTLDGALELARVLRGIAGAGLAVAPARLAVSAAGIADVATRAHAAGKQDNQAGRQHGTDSPSQGVHALLRRSGTRTMGARVVNARSGALLGVQARG